MSKISRLPAVIITAVISLSLLAGCAPPTDNQVETPISSACVNTDLTQLSITSGDGSIGTSTNGSDVTVSFAIDESSRRCEVALPDTRTFTVTLDTVVTDSHMGDDAFNNLLLTGAVNNQPEGVSVHTVKNDVDKNFDVVITVPTGVTGALDTQLQFIYNVGSGRFTKDFNVQITVPN